MKFEIKGSGPFYKPAMNGKTVIAKANQLVTHAKKFVHVTDRHGHILFNNKGKPLWKAVFDPVKTQANLETASNNFQLIDTAATNNVVDWLNAYNAPHWMDIGSQMQYQNGKAQTKYSIPGWDNRQNGTGNSGAVERYGASWMRDLMVAKQYASPGLVQSASWFNGTVDANFVFTPKTHATHDLGMALDLGVLNYIVLPRAEN